MDRELRILHVEDDDKLRRLFQRMMQDHMVVSASSVDEALIELGLDTKFDVIISDFDMGPANGDALYSWVSEQRPELVNRFIFLSGNDKARELGAHFIEKPCTKAKILETINLVLEGIECSCSTSHGSSRIT